MTTAARAQAPSSFPERLDAVARAFEREPKLKQLSLAQRRALTEFVIGNMLFVVAHELGHAVISELELPVLGREEDAADSFAVLNGLKIGSAFSHRVLVEAAKGWFLTDRRDVKAGEALTFYGEHGLNKQRAYQIVCLMVGSDPDEFKDLANETELPADRQSSCRRDYRTSAQSWETVLKPHRRADDERKIKIETRYLDAKGDLAIYVQTFRDIKFLETLAEHASSKLAWNAPFALEMRSCGEVDTYWDKYDRKVLVCYELAQEFAQLFRDYGREMNSAKVKKTNKK